MSGTCANKYGSKNFQESSYVSGSFPRPSLPRIIPYPEHYGPPRHLMREKYTANKITLCNLTSVGFSYQIQEAYGIIAREVSLLYDFFHCTFTILKVPRKGNEWRDAPSKSTCVGSLIPGCIQVLHSTLSNERKNSSSTRNGIPQLVLLQLPIPLPPKWLRQIL